MKENSASPLDIVRQWVAKHSSPDKKIYLIGNKKMSANDFLIEIGNNTEIGRDYCEIIIELINQENDHCQHSFF